MRQWQIVGREEIALREVPIPEPGVDEVLVRVKACSFCSRTDLVYWKYYGVMPHCSGAHFGHEVAGVIERLGPGVQGWQEGDRVFLRGPARGGGFADYCVARTVALGRLPEAMSFVEGAPAQQVPIAVHGTRAVQAGDLVAVFGAGSAGLAVTQAAHVRGAARVVTIDLYDNRLALAKQLGADFTINPRRDDPLRAVPALLGAQPDVVIDVVGIPSVARQCIELVRNEGNVTIFGTYHVEHTVNVNLLQWEIKALSLNMANEGSPQTAAAAMRVAERLLAAGRLSTKPYITHVLPFHAVPEGLALLATSPLLVPEAEMPADLPWNREVIKVVVET
ncbi:MAG: zinc-binding dehydrogenase [Armatimonadetes bacterium]|nr:zinc-binding dehydrogenase [Armatimonadota bacterium]